MTLKLKQYSRIKDSGVEWLGAVPEHWNIFPNRVTFDEVKDRDHPDEAVLSVTITKGILPQKALLLDTSKKDSSNQDKSAYKLVQPGDLAYNKMRAWQGAIGISDFCGIISPAYVVMRLRGSSNPRYFHYLFRIPQFAKEAESWSYGITSDMWSLRPEHFKLIYSCIPPVDEQTAIVKYLDYMDSRIKRYISSKKKLIKLLEEQKQAIIHKAVTRGLDPNVVLKDSGVEWLGEVPEHWEVRRLKQICRFEYGDSLPAEVREEGVVPVFGSNGCVGSHSVSNTKAPCIVIGRKGSFGKVNLSSVPVFAIDTTYVIDKSLTSQDIRWLFYLLGLVGLDDISKDSAVPGLSREEAYRKAGPLPPIQEQLAIVKYLDDITSKINTLIDNTKTQIKLLDDYRTRLIADVVTGKLDVREAVEALPDITTDAEILDEFETFEDEDLEIDEPEIDDDLEEFDA